jgi:hypothetical protein
MPVAATTATNPCTRIPKFAEAAKSAWTSSVLGARTAADCSLKFQSGISVPATGLGNPLPLHFRANLQDR